MFREGGRGQTPGKVRRSESMNKTLSSCNGGFEQLKWASRVSSEARERPQKLKGQTMYHRKEVLR